jgi:hypothetical protein
VLYILHLLLQEGHTLLEKREFLLVTLPLAHTRDRIVDWFESEPSGLADRSGDARRRGQRGADLYESDL